MKRTGECFTEVGKAILEGDPRAGLVAVHGLPTGQGGHAKKVGAYPHAWLESPALAIAYDTVAEVAIPIGLYYQAGEIEYTVRYTLDEFRKMVLKHGTYGPWDEKLLARDDEIDKMIKKS